MYVGEGSGRLLVAVARSSVRRGRMRAGGVTARRRGTSGEACKKAPSAAPTSFACISSRSNCSTADTIEIPPVCGRRGSVEGVTTRLAEVERRGERRAGGERDRLGSSGSPGCGCIGCADGEAGCVARRGEVRRAGGERDCRLCRFSIPTEAASMLLSIALAAALNDAAAACSSCLAIIDVCEAGGACLAVASRNGDLRVGGVVPRATRSPLASDEYHRVMPGRARRRERRGRQQASRL